MKICFVGLGSIGTRHLRNLSGLLVNRGIAFTIDALRSSNRPLPIDIASMLHHQYKDIADLPSDYDVAFICSPTASHYVDISRMVAHARHLFIEKPVFDQVNDLEMLGLREGSTYYVACPLRYHAVLQYLKSYVEKTPIFAARAICSTYLPDWRPETDYRTVYSAHRDMGGGVAVDLIHEWDYLCWFFGFPQRVQCVQGKYSELDLDSDDLAVYLGQYPKMLVGLHLDYFGRFERREIELYTKEDTVVGDILNGEVRFLKQGRTLNLSEPRDTYQCRELEHFFDIVGGKFINDNDVKHALSVLSITQGGWNT